MVILINTASTFKGGGVQVAKSIIEECKQFNDNVYHVVLGMTLSKLISKDSFPSNFHFYEIGFRPGSRVLSLKSHNDFFIDLERKIKPDVVFTTTGPAYWRPNSPHLVGYNLPHYVYRESPYFGTLSFFKRVRWDVKGLLIKYFLKRDSDAFVVQTDDVNNRLQRLIGCKRVFTVSNTISRHYTNPRQIDPRLPVKSPKEFRLLTLSAWYPHKNFGVIKKILDICPEQTKERIKFVLTLPDEVFKNNFPEKYRKNVLNLGVLAPEDGAGAYSECDCMFLPTLLECFSASYAEAMVLGKPILTSDMGFAKTVCHDAALYANPMDPQDILDKITLLMNDKEIVKTIVEKGKQQLQNFGTAKQRAEKYLSLCKMLVESAQPTKNLK